MARSTGTANLAASLEVLAGAPLDARTVVPTVADLTVAENFPYKYIGMPVVVQATGNMYILIGNDVTNPSNWKSSGGESGSDNVVEGYFNSSDNLFYEEDTYTTAITGEENVIYISLDTNKTYRYDSNNEIFVRLDEESSGNFMVKGQDYVTAGLRSGATIGNKATSEGHNTAASGIYSHAEGDNTDAGYQNSHAEGSYTRTGNVGQHVQGKNNVGRAYTAFEIGNGSSIYARGNAVEVDWDASTRIYGDMFSVRAVTNLATISNSGTVASVTVAIASDGTVTLSYGSTTKTYSLASGHTGCMIYISKTNKMTYVAKGETKTLSFSTAQTQFILDSVKVSILADEVSDAYGNVLSEKADHYTAGNGIDITSNVISADAMPSSDMSEVVTPLPGVMSRMPILFDETGEERIVGWYKYSNGTKKPVYEKSISGTFDVSITDGTEIYKEISCSSLSIDKFIGFYNGIFAASSNQGYYDLSSAWTGNPSANSYQIRLAYFDNESLPSQIRVLTNRVVFYNGTYRFTIRYTKTTDTAS